MKFSKNIFLLFGILLIAFSVSGKPVSSLHASCKNSNAGSSFTSSGSNKKAQLIQPEGVLFSCIRLNGSANECLHNFETLNFLLSYSRNAQALFSSIYFTKYTTNRLNHFGNLPGYLFYRCLLI